MDEWTTQARYGHNDADAKFGNGQCQHNQPGWDMGYYEVQLTSSYDPTMGKVTFRITNTLDQGAGDESIGVGNLRITYDFDPNVEWNPPQTINPDEDVANPMDLWQNNCGATESECQGHHYIGGFNECAQGHSFWRTISKRDIHTGANRFVVSGKVWTLDSWDGEWVTVTMTNQHGAEMASTTFQANNFAGLADETLQCGNTQGHW